MIARYSVFILLIIGCGKDEPIKHVDECPSWTSMIEINGANWPSKPGYAIFKINGSNDTSFILEIFETSPTHDTYSNALFFNRIPYKLGEYRLDTHLNSEWGTDVNFNIYEFEYGTATVL